MLSQPACQILIVDDEPNNLSVLGDLLERYGYDVLASDSGRQAIDIANQLQPDLILLDVAMPEMDGFETCRQLKQFQSLAAVPVLFLSAYQDLQHKVQGFQVGGMDFISKPFQVEELLARIRTHLELYQLRYQLELKVAQKTEALEQANRQLQSAYTESLRLLSMASEYRDLEMGLHTVRIGAYTAYLAHHLGLASELCEQLRQAAPLHDIGKVALPDRLLLQPGPLTEADWKLVKTHAEIGANILRSGRSRHPMLELAADIAGNHHERFDGSGYPQGLVGEQIPLAARIVGLVDVYDALRSRRPYKEAYSHQRSLDILQQGDERTRPEHFDPKILALFIEHQQQIAAIYQQSMHLD